MYEVGRVHSGRVTRIAEFGAFIELEPGIEALAHVSTFAPTGRRDEWSRAVPVGTIGSFEILTIDPGQRRIAVAPVDEGSSRAVHLDAEGQSDRADRADGADRSQRTDEPSMAGGEGLGSLGDKLRGALAPRG